MTTKNNPTIKQDLLDVLVEFWESVIYPEFQKTNRRIDTLGAELKSDISKVRTELKAEIKSVKTELKSDIKAVRVELKSDIKTVRTELKSDIKDVGHKLVDIELDTPSKATFNRLEKRVRRLEDRYQS
jgi:gas vesicle protein